MPAKRNPDSLKIGDEVQFLSHKGTVIDFGQYKDLKSKYPSATIVAGRDVDESKFGRVWVIQFDDGIRLMGSQGIRLMLKSKALVAVDLHGTIADKNDQHNGEYDPSAYTLQPGAVEALQELKDDGHEVAIWTCWATEEARQWLDENKVPYDYINEEAPDHGSPKIDADLYLDDKAVRHEGDWNRTLAEAYSTGKLDKALCVIKARDPKDLKEFAAEVNRIARSAPASAKFGSKVYIGYVEYEYSIPGFREKLLEAQRAGLVTLARFDMSYVADQRDVRASEMYDSVASYHFVVPKSVKAASDILCTECQGNGCDVCGQTGRLQVADDKVVKIKRLRYVGVSKTGGEVWYRH